MRKRMLKNMDWGVLLCAVALVVIGLIALFSATQSTGYEEFKKQISWFLISIPIMIIVIFIDYNLLVKISPILYGICIILLIGVLFTEPINGASSWFNLGFFTFQPAEISKIVMVIFLANIITKIQRRDKDQINKPWKLLLVLLSVAVTVILIIKQPDYGTAIAFLVATCAILFVAGIRKRYIFPAIIIIVVAVPILYLYVLPDHAKRRIDVFLDPTLDPRGSGYNIIQSKLAIGAGELFGMGVFKGNQTQLGFLYPKTTDFIFSVIGEEMGFIATGGILIIYIVLLTKIMYIAKTAKDEQRFLYSSRNCGDTVISYDRKYRYDNWIATNNGCTITFCKLWRKFITK